MILLPRHSNHTVHDAVQVICGYPLSGPYQLMPRVVLYPLLVVAFWSRTALVVVMLWTSVAAIHVTAMAKNHSYEALDLDLVPATAQLLLGLVFGPALITLSRGLKKAYRIDVVATCLWLVLLWVGMVSYVATTHLQPEAMPCLDHHGHNISSQTLLSECTFQCFNTSTTHPMRLGQSSVLLPTPSAFYLGRGQTSSYLIFMTVLMALFILAAFWMASKTSFWEYTQQQVRKAKTKKAKEEQAKLAILPPKVAFWSFIILVWFTEDAVKHFPPDEHKDTIGQWGPLVAFALAAVGLILRLLVSADAPSCGNPNWTKFQKQQNAAAMGLTRPHDVESGGALPNANVVAPQEPPQAHVAGGK